MPNEVVKRIFELADKKFDDQKDFASAIGTTPSIVSQWRNNITTSYRKRIDIIASVLDTTSDYLLTGQKEKPALPLESELDEELVTRLTSLTPEERKQVDAFVQGLLASR